ELRTALVARIPPELPVPGQDINILWQEAGFRDRVDNVESEHAGRVILQCPLCAFRVEEILPRRPVEALAPGIRPATRQVVGEPLGYLDLQRIVSGIAGRGSRDTDRGARGRRKLREWIERALQAVP